MTEQNIQIHDDYCKNSDENKIAEILSKITVLLEKAAYHIEEIPEMEENSSEKISEESAPLPNQAYPNKIKLT